MTRQQHTQCKVNSAITHIKSSNIHLHLRSHSPALYAISIKAHRISIFSRAQEFQVCEISIILSSRVKTASKGKRYTQARLLSLDFFRWMMLWRRQPTYQLRRNVKTTKSVEVKLAQLSFHFRHGAHHKSGFGRRYKL